MNWLCLFSFHILLHDGYAPPITDKEKQKTEDHMAGVRIERDGDLNPQFRQEMILSADENIDLSNKQQLGYAIRKMFNETDLDRDSFLSMDELVKRIEMNLRSHISHSSQHAIDKRKLIDRNNDGLITWEEYMPYLTNGDSHNDENGNHVMTKHELIRIEDEKRAFENSDDDNDGSLADYEWLSFLHPEHSKKGLMRMAEQIVKSYDANNDSVVGVDEFVNGIPGVVDEGNDEFQRMEAEDKERRRHEFIQDIDLDGDGRGTVAEFFEYLNPQNIRHAKSEVAEIMDLIDTNKDGKLTLDEMIDRDWLLEKSALLSASRKLHDEM